MLDLRPAHVEFIVDKVATGQVPLRLLRFYLVSIIPLIFHLYTTDPA